MDDKTIINTIRTNEPTIEDIENSKIIIKRLIRTNGIKEIIIHDEDKEIIDITY